VFDTYLRFSHHFEYITLGNIFLFSFGLKYSRSIKTLPFNFKTNELTYGYTFSYLGLKKIKYNVNVTSTIFPEFLEKLCPKNSTYIW
jgi:hypothetical protein